MCSDRNVYLESGFYKVLALVSSVCTAQTRCTCGAIKTICFCNVNSSFVPCFWLMAQVSVLSDKYKFVKAHCDK